MASGAKGGNKAEPTRWESVVDQAIREARERGEFDDLPGAGRPLPNDENPFAGEWAMGFRAMKNAGVVPPWMELGREVEEGLAALEAMREQAGRYRQRQVSRAGEVGRSVEAGERVGTGTVARTGGIRWWRRTPDRGPEVPRRANAGLAGLQAERERARRRYLERAAAVDKKIAAYNAALPDDLWRLRRGSVTTEGAGQEFDAVWAPVTEERTGRIE